MSDSNVHSEQASDHYPSVSVVHDDSQTVVPSTWASDAAWRAAENNSGMTGPECFCEVIKRFSPSGPLCCA